MNRFYTPVVIVTALLFPRGAHAQEALVTLSENPSARPQPEAQPTSRAASASPALRRAQPLSSPDMLSLPFVDDFAGAHPWPDAALWTTNGVYVNSHYALNMPTIGVATFDALDNRGQLYPHLNGVAAPADTLTSLPIALSGGSGVVLSFFYQPGGLGDVPGLPDNLRLEFNAPDTGWTEVWNAAVNTTDSTIIETRVVADTVIIHKFDTLYTHFVYVMLEINDPAWHKDGFQFRFVNNVSLTVNRDVPGRASNADFWHLDFVYLDSGRSATDTLLPDVAIVRPQAPVTADYTSVPAHHLEYAAAKLFPDLLPFNVAYRNLGMGTQNVYRRFSVKPLRGATSPPKEYLGGAENIFDGDLQEQTFGFEPYDFTGIMPGATDVAFEISSALVFDNDNTPLRQALRRNDTTSYVQVFQDYYAYDDGSAENGYGLFGYGTSNGRMAVRFTALSAMTDSLRGVYLYFNMAKDSANLKSFDLVVWDDNGGTPGNPLKREKFDRPAVRDSLNAYIAYKFQDPLPIARNQVFYVGWIQTSEVFLNIGFDANTPANGRNLYALGDGNWYESVHDGALMIRPIFSRTSGDFPAEPVLPVKPAVAAISAEYAIYPNPATDRVFIRDLKADEQGIVPPPQLVEIFDVGGRKCRTGYVEGGMFSVSGLPSGMYIVRVIVQGTLKTSQKIIVN